MSEERPGGTAVEEPDFKDVERRATQRLDAQAGHLEADLEAQAAAESAPALPDRLPIRYLIATALTVGAAGLMVGGIFHAGGIPEDPTTGVAPRVYAIVAGLLGLALATALSRLRGALVAAVLAVVGLFLIGVVMTIPFGPGHVTNLGPDIKAAANVAHISRPPLDFLPGWAAIEGWIMGTIGFGAGWLVLSVGWPSIGVLVPLALGIFAGISIPKGAQIPSGIVVIGLFGAALTVISGTQSVDGESLPRAYEIRRMLRTAPILAAVVVGLFLLAQTNILFPHQLIDPAQQPQKPHPQSLSGAEDRDLFDVIDPTLSGPWVVGHLDVYDGNAWLLPSYASSQNAFKNIPRSGIVDPELAAGAKATFVIRGLSGAVLPDLPDTVGVVAQGPRLVYDARNGNIRLVEGQAEAGFQYSVVAAGPASVDRLSALGNSFRIPNEYQQFTQVPQPPPPAVKALIAQAPKTSKWDEYNWLRNWVLQNVVADGSGLPVDVPPARVDQIVRKKDASPYEIVAVQAIIARWIGLPSRIGYGFDGGTKVGSHLEVHPSNGVSFPEVYFPGFKWVPVIGVPAQAKSNENGGVKQSNPNVLPSQDIGVPLYVPYMTPNGALLYQELAPLGGLLLALIALALLVYFSLPALVKTLRRGRARDLAHRRGPRAELVQAYAEWRDSAMDYGYQHPTDTPLNFTARFVPDEEHSQFAWLVTRALWGDLQDSITPELAAQAREFSRRMRGRLAQAHPITVRAVALFSRLSMRHPFHLSEVEPIRAVEQPRRVA